MREKNLKNTERVVRSALTQAVTGVSVWAPTLVNGILYRTLGIASAPRAWRPAATARSRARNTAPDKVVHGPEPSTGRTPRSNPATRHGVCGTRSASFWPKHRGEGALAIRDRPSTSWTRESCKAMHAEDRDELPARRAVPARSGTVLAATSETLRSPSTQDSSDVLTC